MPDSPTGSPPQHHQPRLGGADPRGASGQDPTSTRHLTVIRGSIRHDVVVDSTLSVGEVLTDVLGGLTTDVFGVGPPGDRWLAVSLLGEVLVGGDSVERAGLGDGSVIVVAAPAPFPPTNRADGSWGLDRVERTGGGRHERRGRGAQRSWGERAATGGLAARVAGGAALVLVLGFGVVVGMRTTGVPPRGAVVLAFAIAAVMSRVVPDLVLRLSGSAAPATPTATPATPTATPATPTATPATGRPPSTGISPTVTGWGGSPDTAAVQRWVRVVARRQVGAHLAVLVVVLVATWIALIAFMAPVAFAVTVGTPVSTRVSGPALVSVFASAMVLAGSARGRGRTDRWILRMASATAMVPALLGLAGSISAPAAMLAASACVVVGLAALAPVWRRRPAKLQRSRLKNGVDAAAAVAALPLGCWGAGLLSVVQSWAHGRP